MGYMGTGMQRWVHKEARLYHALSLFMLCKTENNRCQDALRLIKKYQEEDPENMNLRKITADYFLLMGDTTKALDLMED